ncbi:MAG: hypothetical protein HN742_14115 [Lentisphaerae bacterium]|jgi:1,4-alpha-glucan branching enzyme|nr:hypothetical protein [Lentisphaerota bacterium]MBT4819195.1 hypothetical protein [Lentisphaerota bacterium]MBT5606604.1 hypothetical protein [Lentisphaerota bacterium]MBT7059553.1 hypothetical protein [Lentisphaerota bacterium]MBT7843010.1 hypothetical protein [Lentisphaerota bacterium]
MTTQSTKGRKRVRFQLRADPGSTVCVAGSFNEWDPAKKKMKYTGSVYAATLMLHPGRYEYKFVVDDIWCVDPECPDWVPNDQGSLNSVIVVA